MSNWDMDGIGGMIRKDIEDAERNRKAFEKRFGGKHKPAQNSPTRKAAYHLACDLEKGLKGLFGL